MKNIVFQALAEAARNSEPVTLGLISGVKGSSPQKVGAKALFYSDGRIKGTLGGGCLEAEIQQRAIEALRLGRWADLRRQGFWIDFAKRATGRRKILA
jgi:xanthine dehydrogenase accessory factor